jgi:hypothetical protein
VNIDLERVQEIKQISHPRNKKEVQHFLGKIAILRRFVPNFTKMVNHITNKMKKDHEVKWTTEAKISFQQTMIVLGEFVVLTSPNYNKELLIFSFASIHTIVVVFLQKNEKNIYHHILF